MIQKSRASRIREGTTDQRNSLRRASTQGNKTCLQTALPSMKGNGGVDGGCGCSLLSFCLKKFFILLILITSFYVILVFAFLLSFFVPFLLSWVADRVFMLQPGVRLVSLRWESRVQDICPAESSQLHVISNGKSSPRDRHLNAKPQYHSMTSKLQCWKPYAKKLERQEYNTTH